MLKYLLLLFSLLVFKYGCAQSQDYLQYHKYINSAENHLGNGAYDSTFMYYDKAFGEYDFIFAKDALVAAQFAWKQKNKEKTIEYLLKGARNGLRSKCLDLCPIMKSFTDQRFYNELYDSLAQANLSHSTKVDQALVSEWGGRHGEIVIALSNDEISEYIDAVRNNVARIKEMTAKGMFPGERYIGVGNDCATLSNETLFYSLANFDCIVSEMHDELWTAVKKGELHPREFAAIWEWEFVKSAQKMKYITGPFKAATARNFTRIYMRDNTYVIINRECNREKQQLKRFRLLLTIDDIPMEEVNKNRAQYYITSVETDQKKRELESKEGYRFFFGNK